MPFTTTRTVAVALLFLNTTSSLLNEFPIRSETLLIYCLPQAGERVRVCVVGKYPPIQGGISAQSYWMCRWLAERGHDVDIVTNASEVEDEFRIALGPADADWLAPRFPGGAVKVWSTETPTSSYRHIPRGNPVVTKLASLAANAIEAGRADVVLGFYLEPYAVAAHLAASWTRRPLVIRHAGSDVGRLLEVTQLQRAYVEVLKAATVVCARPAARARMVALGIPEDRIVPDPGSLAPRDLFTSDAPPLDVAALLSSLGETRAIDLDHPIVGLYGKLGAAKGTYDLVAALARLRRGSLRFALLAAAHGSREEEARFAAALHDGGLTESTCTLPFLPHWRVPSFLRACTLVCALERRFPISARSPGVPAEVLACGTPLILSAEIARKQVFAARLIHGYNVLVVRDPTDHDELTGALRRALVDRAALREIGLRGARVLPPPLPSRDQIRPLEEILEQAVEHGAPAPSARSAPEAPSEDEESRSWHALQEPHPDIATNALLDRLFFRAGEGGAAPSAQGAAARPRLADNVVIRPFTRDMESGGAGPCAYAFQHLPFRHRNRVVRLGLLHYLAAELADGAHTGDAIADALNARRLGPLEPDPAAARERVSHALVDLFEEGILTLAAQSS
jgi:glycosyltransferase involved in cell wall biosynthesis